MPTTHKHTVSCPMWSGIRRCWETYNSCGPAGFPCSIFVNHNRSEGRGLQCTAAGAHKLRGAGEPLIAPLQGKRKQGCTVQDKYGRRHRSCSGFTAEPDAKNNLTTQRPQTAPAPIAEALPVQTLNKLPYRIGKQRHPQNKAENITHRSDTCAGNSSPCGERTEQRL